MVVEVDYEASLRSPLPAGAAAAAAATATAPTSSPTPATPESTSKSTHARQRSSTWGPTFFSSTVVPATNQNEVLSSLITSLTALTDATKQQLLSVQELANTSPRTDVFSDADLALTAADLRYSRSIEEPDINNLIENINQQISLNLNERAYKASGYFDEIESDEDVAPPPIAGYSQKTPKKGKASSKEFLSNGKLNKSSHPSLRSLRSQATLRPGTAVSTRSIGIPSIERTRNSSTLSLAESVKSKESRIYKAARMFASSRTGDERPASSRTQASTIRGFGHGPKESYSSISREPEVLQHRPITPVSETPAPLGQIESPSGRTHNILNPLTRGELEEHMIPSRHSSARHNTGTTANAHFKRASTGSRDLKSLDIDQQLIEEDDSTVRRIRELQQAREKRQSEWRREARKSEKHAKHMSLPSPKSSRKENVTSGTRLSVSDAAVDGPGSERTPTTSARVEAQDLAAMPALVELPDTDPLTPTEQITDLKRNMSSSSPQTMNSVKKHKRLSGGLRRSTSLRHGASEDVRSVAEEVEAFLSAPRLTQRIRHPRTGRTIAFSEVGDPDGFVVLCCVGMGLTRYVTTFYDELAKTQRLRLITPDRPGVGESGEIPEGTENPLSWVDDIAVICMSLNITKFSLLAHSAGAIYALATALKMPQYVRGRIHLLAPWIPPSQLAMSGRGSDIKAANLPTSHKILSLLPASFMKAANSRFLSATSASIDPKSRRDRKKERLKAEALALDASLANDPTSVSRFEMNLPATPELTPSKMQQTSNLTSPAANINSKSPATPAMLKSPPLSPTPPNAEFPRNATSPSPQPQPGAITPTILTPQARQTLYNTALTQRIWALATLNSNPALDLIICLERRKPISFTYTDVVRSIVIHHGRLDNRVPLENVTWLASAMKRCELRVLEGESHGLMASAKVMSSVLTEIGREWEEWNVVAKDKERRRMDRESREEERRKVVDREKRRGMPKFD